MVTLLRNLTKLPPPTSGYDDLPLSTDTIPTADLARIKYYRNELAHINDAKIKSAFFTTAWEDITGVRTYQRFQAYNFVHKTNILHSTHQWHSELIQLVCQIKNQDVKH